MINIAKALLIIGLVLLYVVSPIDFVPDFFPGLGQLDDLLAVGFGGKKVIDVLKAA